MLYRTPFFLPLLYRHLTWKIDTLQKEIFLTFDDGPVPGPTEYVLDELRKFNARATFFCIGDNVRKHPDVFQKVIAAGHTIGNHTFNHLKGWNFSAEMYVGNVEKCRTEFIRQGHTPFPIGAEKKNGLFRPPYGRISRPQIKALGDYEIIMWDVLTHDYAKSIKPEMCLKGTLKATRPGSIVVFHDSLKAERNMRFALPRMLDHFSRLKYSFKAL